MRDFSFRTRKANLARMGSEPWDLVVVGGGIVGAGIAREAALRGIKVALVERGDFASGTSGKTSRLVHGGLRYLRNLKFGLVRQAVRERDVLLRRAPALVTALAFTIPAYRRRGTGRLSLRFGLFVYDFLSKDKVLPRRQWLAPARVREREPRISERSLRGGGLYFDALTNDARLVLAVLKAAAEAGAVVANYAEAIESVHAAGRVAGVRVRDRTDGSLFGVQASVVVNATGAWIDWLRTARKGPPTIRPTKGIHVFLPREKVGNREAVVLNAPRDGRVVFVLPWGPLALVGTTDTDYRGELEHVLPDADDVAYLLDSVNAAFPAAQVSAGDVVSAYAGLRPLLRGRGEMKESDISREYEIFQDPDGLISIAGGKLTTQRAMAEAVVDRACRRLGRAVPSPSAAAPLGPPSDAPRRFESMGFDPGTAARLGSRYDPDSFRRWLEEPGARDPIVPALPYLWAEACEAVEAEMAVSLSDVLVRRLGVFYEDPDQGRSVARIVAQRIAEHLGWTATQVEAEVNAYEELVADHRKFKEGHGR
jgi:glycerol-3-phosphate dehydrogenase